MNTRPHISQKWSSTYKIYPQITFSNQFYTRLAFFGSYVIWADSCHGRDMKSSSYKEKINIKYKWALCNNHRWDLTYVKLNDEPIPSESFSNKSEIAKLIKDIEALLSRAWFQFVRWEIHWHLVISQFAEYIRYGRVRIIELQFF